MTLNGLVVEMPATVVYTQPKLYAVTVTEGDRSTRYEAPTMEEAQRMAMGGVPQMVYTPPAKDDDTVEIVTLTEAR